MLELVYGNKAEWIMHKVPFESLTQWFRCAGQRLLRSDRPGSSLYLDRENFYELRVLRVTLVSVFSFIVPTVQPLNWTSCPHNAQPQCRILRRVI